MKTVAPLCVILGVLCAGTACTSEAAPFALRLATNGDVSFGGSDAALGFRIHKEGWTGTITGEPIWEELSGRGRLARDGALGERALPDDVLPVGADLRAARGDDESAGEPPAPPVIPFRMKDDSGAVCVTGRVALVSRRSTTASLTLRAVSLTEIRAECVAMEFKIPAKDMVGLAWRAGDAAQGVFPAKYGEMHLWRGRADSFSYVDPATRKPVELRFQQPMNLLLQDSRLWGPNFSVRVELPKFGRFVEMSLPNEVSGRDAPTARPLSFDCEISHPDGIVVERDEIVTIAAGPDWIPLDLRKNIVAGSALDFSAMGWTDAQAEGNVFADRARSILLKWGKGRTLVRTGAARVSLALDHPESCEVWGLATDGTRMERVPAVAENGRLSFTSEVNSGRGARMFYEIWRKP